MYDVIYQQVPVQYDVYYRNTLFSVEDVTLDGCAVEALINDARWLMYNTDNKTCVGGKQLVGLAMASLDIQTYGNRTELVYIKSKLKYNTTLNGTDAQRVIMDLTYGESICPDDWPFIYQWPQGRCYANLKDVSDDPYGSTFYNYRNGLFTNDSMSLMQFTYTRGQASQIYLYECAHKLAYVIMYSGTYKCFLLIEMNVTSPSQVRTGANELCNQTIVNGKPVEIIDPLIPGFVYAQAPGNALVVYLTSAHIMDDMTKINLILKLLIISKIVFLLSSLGTVRGEECHRCAEEIIKDNWLATGLPTQPEDMAYTKNCAGSLSNVNIKNCGSSACYAAAFVIQGRYAVIRGCPEEFIKDSNVPAAATAQICEYAHYTGTAQVGVDGTDVANPFTGINICVTNRCNHASAIDNSEAFARNPWQNVNCKEKSATVQCIECTHFDGEGWCNWDSKVTCTGSYCTKVVGSLNGRRFEHRGCTSINPLQVDYCYPFNRPINISLLGMSINQELKGTQCICAAGLKRASSHFLQLLWLEMKSKFLDSIIKSRKTQAKQSVDVEPLGHRSWPVLPQPRTALFSECTLFLYSIFALFIQYLNLYKTLWWLPKSHWHGVFKTFLINPYVLSCIGLLLGIRVTKCFWQTITKRFDALNPKCDSVFWSIVEYAFIKSPLCTMITASFLFSMTRITKEFGLTAAVLLITPSLLHGLYELWFIRKELMKVSFTPYAIYNGDTYQQLSRIESPTSIDYGLDIQHECVPKCSPHTKATETLYEIIKCRLLNCLLIAFYTAYYSVYLPIIFVPSKTYSGLTQHFYRETVWYEFMFVNVFMTTFFIYALYQLPIQLLHQAYQTAVHLGYYTDPVKETKQTPIPAGGDDVACDGAKVVGSDSIVYTARCHKHWYEVAATPGNMKHNLFYKFAHNPTNIFKYSCYAQGILIAIQFHNLVMATDWQHICTLVMLMFANYVCFFVYFREYIVVRYIYADDRKAPDDRKYYLNRN
ncbi:unnamed protein product [Bursaphelenchus okinawaensis]|uniref:Uncharacterized protein n=1 Tax=Bursaphelenchus okinawaensis TaxID=465554 RepID=A0A811KA39_9BILA|nr:unnamed protein product [Bursaphelenchus okinawaensis]CAG9096901.1 unnamed protein product [Bursaphelenchus okinawaensis]